MISLKHVGLFIYSIVHKSDKEKKSTLKFQLDGLIVSICGYGRIIGYQRLLLLIIVSIILLFVSFVQRRHIDREEANNDQ